ncbi:HesB-like selenofamily protein [Clostridium argentinense CDC 2741]|uniref:HesB-like selenofamily protein n=1 Tax=Clostridium argentinense CDC 2741 TaxID=1418104 RepID=A0A0C1UFF3_9CLOT|nr:HesB-like protein [Clostridium argentinense]HAG42574.1 HesB-like protein [Clostridium sp.]ARC85000.1 HesB-like protein [Clostridium argentinense]KIE46145.1 HesB-like selenofamily protein [Clostridium argentinense CDC 2741]NFF40477.1 HesB-like protein [Clostridium argentinense]NFP50551.1 HesB-like protein [Clostridium argentinense]
MSIVKMSENAAKEFKQFLLDNEVTANVIRIHFAGMSCCGPSFNLVLDEQKPEDNTEVINEITFLVDKDVTTQFGALTILSGEENGMSGFSIEPEKKPEGGGCSTCSSCG